MEDVGRSDPKSMAAGPGIPSTSKARGLHTTCSVTNTSCAHRANARPYGNGLAVHLPRCETEGEKTMHSGMVMAMKHAINILLVHLMERGSILDHGGQMWPLRTSS